MFLPFIKPAIQKQMSNVWKAAYVSIADNITAVSQITDGLSINFSLLLIDLSSGEYGKKTKVKCR